MSAIRILAKKGALQFLITSPPSASVDGVEQPLAWGQEVTVAAPPGPHQVTVSFRYMGKPRGAATVQVEAGDPGPLVRYKTPQVMTSAGKINLE